MLWIIIPSFLISFSPVFVKLIQLPPTTIAFYRCFIAFIFLFPWFIRKETSLKFIFNKNYLACALAGFFFCADLFTWHRSIVYSGAGLATLLANTQVFYLHIIAWLFLKEKLSFKFLGLTLVCFFGLVLLVNPFRELDHNYLMGVFWGMLAGVCYSFFIMFLQFSKISSQKVKIAHVSLWASIFLVPIMAIEQTLVLPIPSDIPWLILLGVLIQAISWIGIAKGMGRYSISLVGLVLLVQPVGAVIWGRLFFNENFNLLQIFGGIIVLVSIYMSKQIKL